MIVTRVIKRIEDRREKEEKPIQISTISTPNFSETTGITKPAKAFKRTDKLSRCSKQERKMLSKIFSIIDNNTDKNTAELLIQKIEEEFK